MRKVTKNAYLRSFQYKILNNVLYLNKNYLPLVYQTHNYALIVKWKKRQQVTYSIIALIYNASEMLRFNLLIVCIFNS